MFGYEVIDGLTMEEKYHGRGSFLEEEVQQAKQIVLKSAKPNVSHNKCLACESKVGSPLFEKWGLPYYLCPECWTIFAPSLVDEVKAFEKMSPLARLHRSDGYQEYANDSRGESWKSLIRWVEHRIFRYLDRADSLRTLIRGTRYTGLFERLQSLPSIERLDSKGSMVLADSYSPSGGYDVLFYLDTIQHRANPAAYLAQGYRFLRENGLLFLTTRIGTGLDILSLQDRCETLYPYEHIFLPSVQGLRTLLEKQGFVVLEASTPGMFDVAHVFKQRDRLPMDNHFMRFIMSNYNEYLFADLQKLLQKHGLSSCVNIVAKRV